MHYDTPTYTSSTDLLWTGFFIIFRIASGVQQPRVLLTSVLTESL
jgi:hypothetical protein